MLSSPSLLQWTFSSTTICLVMVVVRIKKNSDVRYHIHNNSVLKRTINSGVVDERLQLLLLATVFADFFTFVPEITGNPIQT